MIFCEVPPTYQSVRLYLLDHPVFLVTFLQCGIHDNLKVNGFQQLIIFAKRSILDVSQGSEYANNIMKHHSDLQKRIPQHIFQSAFILRKPIAKLGRKYSIFWLKVKHLAI